ncbi:TonB-dependent receptor [Coprobacter secundus]|uniref:SusC/RagA family TonB-linked outer membrane protein n=1 Tax=Coprobacter secundus subsp. similis TaxID=2751153 RepID=A0A7G1HU33_9BACT|nr:TonB-dependent receptor [Coprobacter secundus]BCI61934.1 SusC/RagA family TonB-linked outer membrane protein [Coprobacter secundus subsp. similis]
MKKKLMLENKGFSNSIILFRFMKITRFLFLIGMLNVCAFNAYSQNAKVTLNRTNTPLQVILNDIESRTNYLFIIINGQVDTQKKYSIKVKSEPVSSVLDKLFKGEKISYKMKGNHIVLSRETEGSKEKSKRKLTGYVKDNLGEPLVGASIHIQGTQQGTVTDLDGYFHIEGDYDENTVLSIRYVGMEDKNVVIADKNSFNIIMDDNNRELDEVVVVGYGTQKKINLSGAVEAVSGTTLENRSANNVGVMLQGLVPNLNINVDGGQLNQTPSFNIRGATTITNGGSPLILVDGIPMAEAEFSRMNSADIESISVLKDASSAAIYGARAAFGVILVTTKKGKEGKTKFSFNNTVNVRTLGRMPEVVKDPYIQASYKDIMGAPWYDLYTEEELEYAKQRSLDPSLSPVMINPKDPNRYSYLGATDWFHELYSNTGFSHSHSIGMSGATAKTSYYLGGEYFGESGMLRYNTDKANRYNLRSNVSYQVTDWLNISNNTSMTYYTYKAPSSLDSGWLYTYIHNANALTVPKNPDGSWTENGAKYIAGTEMGGESETEELLAQTQVSFDISLIKNVWSVKGDLAIKFWNKHKNYWESDKDFVFRDGPDSAPKELGWSDFAKTEHDNSRFTLFNIYSNFNKKFGKHELGVTVGFEQQLESAQYFTGQRDGLISNSAPSIAVSSGENKELTDYRYSWATRSGFYRLNYMFGDRYIFEANGRYDGTSRFQKDHRFGFFPSFSAAWVISNEEFYQPIKDVMNAAKLRASYGWLGNQNVGYYEYISNMSFYECNYLIDGKKPIGVGSPNLISGDLTWEKVNTIDVGLDLAFFGNRLTFSGDVYRRNTLDMLTPGKTLPGVLGVSSPRQNAADLKTQGWEISLGWQDQFSLASKPFSYSVKFNLSDSWAEITRFNNETGTLDDYYAGWRMGDILGLTTEGFFQSEEDIKNHADQWEVTAYPGDRPLAPGDLKYKDLNNDGYINKGKWTIDDHGDYSVIGNESPRYCYGADINAAWNGFDFRILLQGVGKKDWYPNVFTFFGIYRAPWSDVYTNNLDHWTPENPDGYFPRLKSYTAETDGDMSIPQTRYLQNAAYMRIKNITFGYSLPQNLTRKIKIDQIRFYFSGENVAEFTKLSKNVDPEGLGLVHPMQRVFSFGLNLNF